ncbi:hypothetical protein TNCT_568071 [Trichonephila clavata]|uniref:Uncharacterized protein n=1 Tax=Trichonephila clavata TaxID=2740835 RepID=A0A8X6HBP8_TRICU|nr:hypothetical protein TNCT_568071 [Trichonephila clavata]
MKLKDNPVGATSGGRNKLHSLYKQVQEPRRYPGNIRTKKADDPVLINLATLRQPTTDKPYLEGQVLTHCAVEDE